MSDEFTLLKLNDVKQILKVGTTFVYELIKRGKLPAPIKQGRASFWRASDIKKYIDNLGN